MLNTAVVGCGAIASRWLRVLHSDPRIAITALVDPDELHAGALADRYDVRASTTATLDQAIASGPLDVVVNLTPPALHAEVSQAALTAGLHVLTEKPLTTSLADAVQLTTLAHRVGRTLAVMSNRAHDPGFRDFRDRVAGFAGPLAVAADVCVQLRDPGFRADQPWGVTTDLAVHAFDQIQTIIPAAPLVVSCAETPLPFLGSHCALTHVSVTFEDGSVFSYRGGYTGRGLVTSATGWWRVDGPDAAARWEPDPAGSDQRAPGYRVCLIGMLDALHAAPSVPSTANLRSIAMLDAALTSARIGSPVAVAAVPEPA